MISRKLSSLLVAANAAGYDTFHSESSIVVSKGGISPTGGVVIHLGPRSTFDRASTIRTPVRTLRTMNEVRRHLGFAETPGPRRLAGHKLTMEWSGEYGEESSSTGTCPCGWEESASSQAVVRDEYRWHIDRERKRRDLHDTLAQASAEQDAAGLLTPPENRGTVTT